MKSGRGLLDIVQTQIKLEKTTAKKIVKLEKATANLAAKLFLAEMRFDTEKHAKILQTMLDIMKQKDPEIATRTLWDTKIHSYVDALVAKKMLEDHVKIETNMLKHVEEEMRRTDDDALKLLLKHIADDERKHHKIMETILKKAYEMGP
jgi:bacterioferritin (cytochrome b1)